MKIVAIYLLGTGERIWTAPDDDRDHPLPVLAAGTYGFAVDIAPAPNRLSRRLPAADRQHLESKIRAQRHEIASLQASRRIANVRTRAWYEGREALYQQILAACRKEIAQLDAAVRELRERLDASASGIVNHERKGTTE